MTDPQIEPRRGYRDPPVPPPGLAGHPAFRIAAIALGGAVGTLVRYGLGRALVAGPTSFPWATFVVNVVGAALIGIVVTLASEVLPHRPHLRPLLAVGFCGGLTTFSTLMVQTVQLGRHHRPGLAATYLVVSVVVGLAVAALAVAATRRLVGTRPSPHLIDPDTLGRLDDEAAT